MTKTEEIQTALDDIYKDYEVGTEKSIVLMNYTSVLILLTTIGITFWYSTIFIGSGITENRLVYILTNLLAITYLIGVIIYKRLYKRGSFINYEEYHDPSEPEPTTEEEKEEKFKEHGENNILRQRLNRRRYEELESTRRTLISMGIITTINIVLMIIVYNIQFEIINSTEMILATLVILIVLSLQTYLQVKIIRIAREEKYKIIHFYEQILGN